MNIHEMKFSEPISGSEAGRCVKLQPEPYRKWMVHLHNKSITFNVFKQLNYFPAGFFFFFFNECRHMSNIYFRAAADVFLSRIARIYLVWWNWSIFVFWTKQVVWRRFCRFGETFCFWHFIETQVIQILISRFIDNENKHYLFYLLKIWDILRQSVLIQVFHEKMNEYNQIHTH